jgi:hypothetical protein
MRPRPAAAPPAGGGGVATACVSVPRAAYSAALSPGLTAFRLSMTMIIGFALFAAIRLSIMTSTCP